MPSCRPRTASDGGATPAASADTVSVAVSRPGASITADRPGARSRAARSPHPVEEPRPPAGASRVRRGRRAAPARPRAPGQVLVDARAAPPAEPSTSLSPAGPARAGRAAWASRSGLDDEVGAEREGLRAGLSQARAEGQRLGCAATPTSPPGWAYSYADGHARGSSPVKTSRQPAGEEHGPDVDIGLHRQEAHARRRRLTAALAHDPAPPVEQPLRSTTGRGAGFRSSRALGRLVLDRLALPDRAPSKPPPTTVGDRPDCGTKDEVVEKRLTRGSHTPG